MIAYKKGFFLISCLVCCSAIAAAPMTSLERVRVRQTTTKVRFVFDANKPIHYKKFQLGHPPRFIIDMKHARIAGSLNFPLFKRNPVKRIRVATQPNGHLRLVLDLKRLTRIKTFTLNPSHGKPYRLVVDFFAKTNPMQTAKKKEPLKDVVIMIDPGHGGKDPGATGPGGAHEKNIVLKIAKKLCRIINQQPGFRAVLTRNRDVYLSLRRRLAITRQSKADMFIAIHADAYRNHSARGASVYALSSRGATSEAARWLAKRENASELMGGVNLSNKGNLLKSVLINLSQTATIRASLMVGEQMIDFLDRIAYLHHPRVEQAAFVVLKSPDIPSLLVETGFLSNHFEERRLQNSAYQNRLALAIMKGVRRYFTRRPPRHTWLAYWRDRPKKQKYIVHRGDTLTGLAQRYQVSVNELKELNKLHSSYLRVGQVLSIPAAS